MKKSIRFLLLAVLTLVCGSVSADEAMGTTVTWQASNGDPLTTIYPDGNISLKWEEGGGDFAPKYSGSSVYFYNGNRLIVAGTAEDVVISKIVFTFSNGSVGLVTCNASGKNESTTGITNDTEAMTCTWEGEAGSLIFRASQRTGVRYISSIAVTYTGGSTGPVETAPVLNISNNTLGDTYDMDVNGVFVVYAKNEGNAAAENTKVTVSVDGTENTIWEIGTLAIGEEKWQNVKFNLEGLETGEHTVQLSLTADNAEAFNLEKTVTFTKKAPEATFSVSATDVTVPYGAESYQVVATVKNTSETVAAEGVQVMLQRNIQDVVEPQTVSLSAGEEKQVTFTVAAPEGGFTPGETGLWVVVKAYEKTMAQQEVVVTFEEAPVDETVIVSLTQILGISEIDLAAESNTISVWCENQSEIDVDATINVTLNGTALTPQTITLKAKDGGYASFTLPTDNLVAGQKAIVVATLIAENNTSETTTLTKEYDIVDSSVVVEPEFTLTADDVEVEFDEETINVTVNVENVSEVDANEVVVKLYNGLTVLGETTISSLAAGANQDVVFSFANTFTAGVYELQAMAGKAGCYIKVTVLEEPVTDLAITAITGTIELTAENSELSVYVNNNGNVDVNDVTLSILVGENVIGTSIISVMAGKSAICPVTISTEGLSEGNVEITAKVEVEGDATPDDNVYTYAFNVTTAIETVKVNTADMQIYTIGGKRVYSMRKGQVYIIRSAEGKNGKKTLVK
ncbi:MAG: hypothetical protein K5896_13815 [Prevotella sp.]|nr:hypothetical protein [Prevotella sp.]